MSCLAQWHSLRATLGLPPPANQVAFKLARRHALRILIYEDARALRAACRSVDPQLSDRHPRGMVFAADRPGAFAVGFFVEPT